MACQWVIIGEGSSSDNRVSRRVLSLFGFLGLAPGWNEDFELLEYSCDKRDRFAKCKVTYNCFQVPLVKNPDMKTGTSLGFKNMIDDRIKNFFFSSLELLSVFCDFFVYLNTLRLGQNGHLSVLQIYFYNENTHIFIQTSLKSVLGVPLTKWLPFWQTTISNAFSWMKMIKFRFKCHWNVFPGIQ